MYLYGLYILGKGTPTEILPCTPGKKVLHTIYTTIVLLYNILLDKTVYYCTNR